MPRGQAIKHTCAPSGAENKNSPAERQCESGPNPQQSALEQIRSQVTAAPQIRESSHCFSASWRNGKPQFDTDRNQSEKIVSCSRGSLFAKR